MISIVEEYWQGVAHRLQVEADFFNRLIMHNGEVGTQNEASLAQMLRRMLPPTVGVGSGIVFDSEGRRSKQSDVVVYDQATQPSLLAQTTQMLFPVETVLLVVEVKTTVTTDEIDDVAMKVDSLRQLKAHPGSGGTVGPLSTGFFGYTCGQAPGTIVKELAGLGQGASPNVTCVMRPGIFGSSAGGVSAGLVPLHQEDKDGNVLSKQWVKPRDPKDLTYSLGSSLYPVTPIAPYSQEKVVGNPGRALLLFCGEVLDILASRGSVQSGWLTKYLPATAREMI